MSTKKSGTRTMPKDFQELVSRIKRSETFDQEVLRADIADQISCLMKVQGVSNAELARRLKTSRAYITKILQGNANFTTDNLVQIARALDCRYTLMLLPKRVW